MNKQLLTIIYCLILWLTNWSLEYSYDREHGLTYTSIDLRVFTILFSLIASYFLLKKMWRIVRQLLDEGVKVPLDKKLVTGKEFLVLLLPLLFGVTTDSNGLAADGTEFTKTFEYGGSLSVGLIFVAAIFIILFNTLVNLEAETLAIEKEDNN